MNFEYLHDLHWRCLHDTLFEYNQMEIYMPIWDKVLKPFTQSLIKNAVLLLSTTRGANRFSFRNIGLMQKATELYILAQSDPMDETDHKELNHLIHDVFKFVGDIQHHPK